MVSNPRKKVIGMVMSVVILSGVIAIAGACAAPGPTLEVPETAVQPTVAIWPPVSELHADTEVAILGSGFEAGQEIFITVVTADGVTTDITDYLRPYPIVIDERGIFAVLWTIDRYERVLAEGVFGVVIRDQDYNPLATAPVGFGDPEGRSRAGLYPRGNPDYEAYPEDYRPLPWTEPFFEYPERPE